MNSSISNELDVLRMSTGERQNNAFTSDDMRFVMKAIAGGAGSLRNFSLLSVISGGRRGHKGTEL